MEVTRAQFFLGELKHWVISCQVKFSQLESETLWLECSEEGKHRDIFKGLMGGWEQECRLGRMAFWPQVAGPAMSRKLNWSWMKSPRDSPPEIKLFGFAFGSRNRLFPDSRIDPIRLWKEKKYRRFSFDGFRRVFGLGYWIWFFFTM